MGALFMLGIAELGVLADARWSSARLMLQVESFMLALILVAAARGHADFDTSRPLTFLLLGGFAVALASAVGLSMVMDGRARQQSGVPEQ